MSNEANVRSPVKPGDIVGGKYCVDRILGAGGMGVVVAATHTELGQQVALKFILPESISGKASIERFMREARAVARLKSEHVARVFDVGRDEHDNPYMVLELLEGLDLAKANKQRGPFAVPDAVEYVLQVCEALVEAHSAGIVHRDLKPQNVFVSRRLNGTPLVKVLDFGIAKSVGAAAVGQMALTDSQSVIGSPLYMAPEHMRSARAADVRSDIWSLGVMLYELLGGQLPFDGETVTEVCIRVVNEPPPSLQLLRPELDERLVQIVTRCIDKDPAARWQNVAQLASALEPFSRSAQQGAMLRPWRSLEDTMDSRPPQATGPNDTGPSTAVTMPTGEEIARALERAAPETMPVAGPVVAARPADRASDPMNVSWGQRTDPTRQASRGRFAAGIVVGAAVSIAVAAALVLTLNARASSKLTEASAAKASTPAAVSAPPAAVPLPTAVAEPAVVATALSPSNLPAAPPANGRPRVASTASGRASPPSDAKPNVPSAPTGETLAPNGAPILR
jgi:serine/threonine protein kinase